MPNETENKYDSGHVILPVLHSGSGEVHNVAVPENTPMPELHDALLDSGYHSNWAPYRDPKVDPITGRPRPNYGPTKEGVLENSPEFKSSAKAVFEKSGSGRNPNEAGTYLEGAERGPISVSDTEGRMALSVPTSATATIHTHPAHFNGAKSSPLPSPKDVETARKLKRPVYVVSPEGLSVVEGDGKITSIYSAKEWMERNNK
jgi:hypothetical protein